MTAKNKIHQISTAILCVFVFCACTITTQESKENESSITKDGNNIRLYANIDQTYILKSSLDLSTGSVTSPDHGDIQFTVSRGGSGTYFYAFQPLDGAKSYSVGGASLGFSGCERGSSRFTTGSNPEILIGDFICIVTKQGLLAQVEIQNMNLNEGWIEIRYDLLKD